MTRRITGVIVGITFAFGLSAVSDAAVLLNFTNSDHLTGTDPGADISPGQQVGGVAGSTWNQINTGSLISSIVDDAGNALTGVTVDVGAALSGSVLDYDETPNFSNLGGDWNTGVFASNAKSGMFNSNSNGNGKVGVRVSGLAPGTYTVYVTGLNTNTTSTNRYNILAGTVDSASGDTDFTGFATEHLNFFGDTPKITTHWAEGVNYVAMSVTLGTDEDLVIVSDGLVSGQDRGFLNTVEIVIPEPASLALLGAGGLMMMVRRRK